MDLKEAVSILLSTSDTAIKMRRLNTERSAAFPLCQ